MKVNGCFNCFFCYEHRHCDLANEDVSYINLTDKYYPEFCPLLKGPIMVELDKGEPQEF